LMFFVQLRIAMVESAGKILGLSKGKNLFLF